MSASKSGHLNSEEFNEFIDELIDNYCVIDKKFLNVEALRNSIAQWLIDWMERRKAIDDNMAEDIDNEFDYYLIGIVSGIDIGADYLMDEYMRRYGYEGFSELCWNFMRKQGINVGAWAN